MGEIRASVTLENSDDRALVKRGHGVEAEVRRTTVEGIVDTGAVSLVIPEEVSTQLGLEHWGTTTVVMRVTAGPAQGGKGMQGATIRGERSLHATLRQGAARQLGTGATDDEIEELAKRLYDGPRHKDAGKRTPMERRHEERMRQATRDALERADRR